MCFIAESGQSLDTQNMELYTKYRWKFSVSHHVTQYNILSDKRNTTAKNQSCFIQAVISSNYVEINQPFSFHSIMF